MLGMWPRITSLILLMPILCSAELNRIVSRSLPAEFMPILHIPGRMISPLQDCGNNPT
jgi:hypothetical protein